MNKSLLTSLCAALLTAMGLIWEGPLGLIPLSVGLFALSGSLTNWLAVHMLFEKVPGFYGSGVIPAHFQEFRAGIKSMVMEQFFQPRHIEAFAESASSGSDPILEDLVRSLDYDKAFDALQEVVLQSPFGSMLSMLGGREALQPLREPFAVKMGCFLEETVSSEAFRDQFLQVSAVHLHSRVEKLVSRRLLELTPEMVKEIVQAMIRRHLGWLVVWGGVVGGLLGLVVALLRL